MSVRFTFCDVQIWSVQKRLHKRGPGGRYPDSIRFTCFDAALKDLHSAFLGCFWSARNPPREKNNLAFWAMGTDFFHKTSHRLGKIRGHRRATLSPVGFSSAKMPSIEYDKIPFFLGC